RALQKNSLNALLIKWPNDVLLQGKKIGGVLCEMDTQGKEIRFVVLGVGLNVLQGVEDFPEALRESAGSLKQLTGREWSRSDLLKDILTFLFQEIKALESGHIPDLVERWQR